MAVGEKRRAKSDRVPMEGPTPGWEIQLRRGEEATVCRPMTNPRPLIPLPGLQASMPRSEPRCRMLVSRLRGAHTTSRRATPTGRGGAGSGRHLDEGVGSTVSGRLRNPVQRSAASAARTRITMTIVGARLPRAGDGADDHDWLRHRPD